MRMPSSTLVQTAVFAVGVLLLGLLNSFVNPSALDLGNDYFPANPAAVVVSGEPLEHGYATTSYADLFSYLDLLYEEPPFVVVLDARSAEHYAAGHIPGAFLLDQFHQDRYIDALLPTLKQAAMVVVYCTGGDCEDSIFLSNSLVYHYGMDKDSISIFEGGVALWEEQGSPLKEGSAR
jgi:rhodanese-related sulfurtransferase